MAVSVANALLFCLPSSDGSACRSSICIVMRHLYSVSAANASVRCLFAPCGFYRLASTLFPFCCRWTVTQQYLVYPRAACCALYPLISFGCSAKWSHVYPCAACCLMYCLVPPCGQSTAHGPPAGAEFIVGCAANSFHVYPRAACCVLYFSHLPFGCLSKCLHVYPCAACCALYPVHLIWLSCQVVSCISLRSLLRHVCSVPPCGQCVQHTSRWWSELSFCGVILATI
ncbi:uncharacterized protein EV420DRAFT_690265 [Desarmillaria tabescens]|uniref:Uncharacterized protein n=1 Tax=Armillaria tabescens TaxID=1929756 RepID=A0AA39K2P8_ARMTA|nr:uncharacterized protein EV420DRAFT_690265 [Desarmillaria tabescens]KAK0452064.1 hypothetical protein EV420DRAFT_690265 [Desarmillaria tabescens]